MGGIVVKSTACDFVDHDIVAGIAPLEEIHDLRFSVFYLILAVLAVLLGACLVACGARFVYAAVTQFAALDGRN